MVEGNTEEGQIPDVRNDAASEGGRGEDTNDGDNPGLGNPATDAPASLRPADAEPISPTDETVTTTETEDTTTTTETRPVEDDGD